MLNEPAPLQTPGWPASGRGAPGGRQPAAKESPTDRHDEERRTSTRGAPVIHTPEEESADRREVVERMARTGLREHRDIECHECAHVHSIPADAASVVCPRCGEYAALTNYDIRDDWSRPIRTRGNVFVHHGGRIEGVPVHCHHLTVEGTCAGQVRCTGDLVIRHDGVVPGRVECERLSVENRAAVAFTGSVHAAEIFIDGIVRGRFHSAGRLTLLRGAILDGDVEVAALAIHDGARHTGLAAVGGSLARSA